MAVNGKHVCIQETNIHETAESQKPDTHETNTHGIEGTSVRSDREIREIVEDALLRGEEANLIYLGEFNDDYNAPSIEGFEAVNMEVQYNALSSQADVLKLLSGIKSTDDIKDCFYRAFTRQLAEKFINDIFGEAGSKYIFEHNRLYVDPRMPMAPLSLGVWSREPISVVRNTENEIIVQLEFRFYLTGNKRTLPLSIKKVDGIWLLDDSFCPVEYIPQPVDRTNYEISVILNDALTRGRKASLVHQAGFDTVKPVSSDGFALIDTLNQTKKLNFTQFSLLELVRSLKDTNVVKQSFYDAFVPDVAEKYIEDLFNDRFDMFRDTEKGLTENIAIAGVQICMGLWQTDHFTVWESSENRLVLLLIIDYPDFSLTRCRPLRIHKIGGKWLLDQSYEGGTYWYTWDQ
ncbi:MAG TPA: hypothetical protein PK127_01960 [Clostridiales bacterium]|nr:hypothetical protein [Clostridiales bacterium]